MTIFMHSSLCQFFRLPVLVKYKNLSFPVCELDEICVKDENGRWFVWKNLMWYHVVNGEP